MLTRTLRDKLKGNNGYRLQLSQQHSLPTQRQETVPTITSWNALLAPVFKTCYHSQESFQIHNQTDTGMNQTAAADDDNQTEHVSFMSLYLLYSVLLLPFVLRSWFLS